MRKVLLLLVPLLVPAVALAQPKPAPAPPPPTTTTPILQGNTGGAVPTNIPVEIPPPPTVNDPMLTPVPPAQQTLSRWQEALSLVKARSTGLRSAYDDVKRAEAQTRIALAGALPTITASAIGNHDILTRTIDTPTGSITSPSPQDWLSGNLSGTLPILALQTWHSIGTARVNEEATRLSVEDLKRNIVLGVANAIVGVVTAERIAELNRVGFRNALERLDLTTRKRNLGAANGLDVVRAQQDVESTRATLVTGDESLRQARESLGLSLGIPQQVGVTRDINLDGLEQDTMQACKPAQNLDDRPDIASSRKQLQVAKRNIDNVWLQFAPTLTARSTATTATNLSDFSPPISWNIQGVLTIPIFEGGARYGQLRNARAIEDQAEQNLEGLRRTATIQVVQAQRGVSVAEASRKVAFDARALAAETDRLQRVAYQEGQGTSLELVTAAAALRQAEITLALREFGLVQAKILAVLSLATCNW